MNNFYHLYISSDIWFSSTRFVCSLLDSSTHLLRRLIRFFYAILDDYDILYSLFNLVSSNSENGNEISQKIISLTALVQAQKTTWSSQEWELWIRSD